MKWFDWLLSVLKGNKGQHQRYPGKKSLRSDVITGQRPGSRHLSCGCFISVHSPHKSSHQNCICSSCRWLQQHLWSGRRHIIPSVLPKVSHLLEDWASESKPGDVETGTIAAQQRTDIAHVSVGGKIHDAGSFPGNMHSLPSNNHQNLAIWNKRGYNQMRKPPSVSSKDTKRDMNMQRA